jgi:hypothetical protein
MDWLFCGNWFFGVYAHFFGTPLERKATQRLHAFYRKPQKNEGNARAA